MKPVTDKTALHDWKTFKISREFPCDPLKIPQIISKLNTSARSRLPSIVIFTLPNIMCQGTRFVR